MPRPFVRLTIEEFRRALQTFPFTRQINMVHVHHTFRPNHAQYRGLASIESMFRVHTTERRFADIAQHITIGPDGVIFTGRNWNAPPASATGHNGNAAFGPFMFEMIGDFDRGRDPFENPQRETALQVIVAVQKRFGLSPDALRFHREMANKTCPGSAIDRNTILDEVRKRHAGPRKTARAVNAEGPSAEGVRDDGLTADGRAAVESAVEALRQALPEIETAHEAELHETEEAVVSGPVAGPSAEAAARELGRADVLALRPHVINLHQGMLTEGGEFSTLPEDVERLFGEDMERAFADPETAGMPARAAGEPLRVMLWAHGGLINETQGLGIAQKHREFWLRNGVYPVYVVWETGLLQTLGQLLRGILPEIGARNIFSDAVSDPALERVVRAAGGEMIWSGMKRNAERAVLPSGGGLKVAEELKKFCDRHPDGVELHAGGHSAGSIFLAHFLPAAFDAGVPDVAALYLLAPAIRVDTFKRHLLGLIGTRIRSTTLLTMFRERERADHCARIYRKSLLYLIRFALEQEQEAAILGLEESLRRDRDVAALFGLGGLSRGAAEVVFSPSRASDGPSASHATTHGGFDDDARTMNALAFRILNPVDGALRMRYPERARDIAVDAWTVPEVGELQRSFASAIVPVGTPPPPLAQQAQAPTAAPFVTASSSRGRKRALCIGIDSYPVRPLAGCVADARLWARTLQGFGFACEMLLDGDATYDNITSTLARLIASARDGDVLVWQYAGHGTQVPDVNGDERGGDSARTDEAICPIDMQSGRLLVDDEIAVLLEGLARGVNFTMLIDCCHSGTINRFGLGAPSPGAIVRDERARFVPLSDEVRQAYVEFAQAQPPWRGVSRGTRGIEARASEVLFSACLSTEVAWESNGQGEFTLRATNLLKERGLSLTNEAFMEAVVSAFGDGRRQTPNLTSTPALRGCGLLQPFASPSPDRLDATGRAPRDDRFATLADAVAGVADALRAI